ncbi:gustatory receptor for sugar taste 64f-like [Folsomia candida]|nr:gustatory receptor for sugar taste 64f-like [Folsomia candida]
MSGILENVFWNLQYFPLFNGESAKFSFSGAPASHQEDLSPLHNYYRVSHDWEQLIPYHPFWGVFVFLTNKTSLYAWNYVDVLIGIFARALYGQFKGLYEIGSEIVMASGCHNDASRFGDHASFWSHLVRDCGIICQVVAKFQEFLSQIIFVTYAGNIYFLCLQILLELSPTSPSESVLSKIYATWSFLQIIMRFFTMSLLCARIYSYAHKFTGLLEKCPMEMYTPELARFERKLQSGSICFTGLDCFVITKPLILNVIGVIVTFEIILLQSLSQSAATVENCNCTKV